MSVLSSVVTRSPAFVRPAGQAARAFTSTPPSPGAVPTSPQTVNPLAGTSLPSTTARGLLTLPIYVPPVPGPVLANQPPPLPTPPPFNPALYLPPPSTGPFPGVTWTEAAIGGGAVVAAIAAIVIYARRRRAA